MPFRLVALDHVQLAMPPGVEAEAAADGFYAGLLGLERVPKPEPLASRGGRWYASGAVTIHLGADADFRPAVKAHPGVAVEGLDGLAARLVAAGVPLRWDEELPGIRRCHIRDPWGNRLELIAAGQVGAGAEGSTNTKAWPPSGPGR